MSQASLAERLNILPHSIVEQIASELAEAQTYKHIIAFPMPEMQPQTHEKTAEKIPFSMGKLRQCDDFRKEEKGR
jgi:hypothetical protein